MTLRQRRHFARAVLVAFAAFGAMWLLRLDFANKISTDVLDLIPPAERAPELALVRELASKAEARTMLVLLTGSKGAPAPLEAAQRFAAALRGSPSFAQVVALGDTSWRDDLARELFASRFALLFPLWLRDHERRHAAAGIPLEIRLSSAAATELKSFLETQEALAFQDILPADPLLLMPRAFDRLQGLARLHEDAAAATGLVWAQLAASPLSEAGQAPAFAAIDAAVAAARTDFSGLEARYTGVNRFAAASRTRIQREVAWLNLGSVAAVLALAFVFIRRIHRGLHLLPAVLLAVLGGWVAVTMAFERVHIVVLVIGSMLAGVAIDYGFYLYLQPPARPGEEYGEKVRRLLKPLLASCLTTVAGFSLLIYSELPLIRQVGVFVAAGLLCALGAALLYFSTLERPFLELRAGAAADVIGDRIRRRGRWLLIALGVAALAGLARLTWRDDVRDLEVPSPELKREDASIRAAFGEFPERVVWLTHGRSRDEARRALDLIDDWLEGTGSVVNLGAVIPTTADYSRALRFVRENSGFAASLRTALERQGFDVAAFAPFFDALAQFTAGAEPRDLDLAVERLQAKLVGPARLLLHVGEGLNWFVTIGTKSPASPPPAEANTIAVSQLQTLNRLFARYRDSALRLSLAGLLLVGIGVMASHGPRDGARIFAIPCGTCLAIFGIFGWMGQPLNLFHLLGAFLGVCLTHDYSIFSAASAYRGERPPVSVRISALTTAASFGVLALSGIPVVHALGVTVMSMVIAALVVIELEPLRPLSEKR